MILKEIEYGTGIATSIVGFLELEWRMKMKVLKILILFSFLSISVQNAYSVDELHLTGLIKSYDKEKGLIRVDVLSEGCRGLREFRVPESVRLDLEPSLIGQRIEFQINSSRCENDRVYNMILGGKR